MADEPLAYLITSTTYGTWLPGDGRGWVKKGSFGIQDGDAQRENTARRHLKHTSVTLDST